MTLTLPGDIPGLLRRCSPLGPDSMGVLCGINPEMDDDRTHLVLFHEGYDDWHSPKNLALDLEDQTGRAHAAWWLAERLRPDVKELMKASVTYGHTDFGGGGYGLGVTCRDDGALWRRADAPGLDDLDPHDPRTLDDGSRWVDAEALRLVCLHVAGRSV
jgi:hypothetical protein